MLRHLSCALIVGMVVGCKRAPVVCADFTMDDGSRASLTTLDKPEKTYLWKSCADGKTRRLTCTTGHLHKLSCTCEVNDGKTYSDGRVKTNDDFPPDRAAATTFGNRWCEFRVQ
jgi:hypothetical protein